MTNASEFVMQAINMQMPSILMKGGHEQRCTVVSEATRMTEVEKAQAFACHHLNQLTPKKKTFLIAIT